MKEFMWRPVLLLLLVLNAAQAQKRWDGGAATSQWNDGLNWAPDGVPGSEDDIILDNQWVEGNYSVELPASSQTISVKTVRISPASGIITLLLPATNTAVPGLLLSGSGESLALNNKAVFINASGAASGSPFQMTGKMRVNNGGRYIHRTLRGNAELIDKLVHEQGTETGIFEFDVPGTAGYTVSLTGNTFGSLVFRAAAAGGLKSYSGSGISNLLIRGDLVIEAGAQVTSTLNADIELLGSLQVNGKLNLHPSTAGTTGRSFVFGGKDVVFQVVGTFSMNAFFRNMLVAKNASLTLETPCLLSLTPNTFICQGTVRFKSGYLGGPGSFLLSDDGRIIIGSPDGISQTGDIGDVRTAFRSFSGKAGYHFEGSVLQVSGDGIPDSVADLVVKNAADLRLSKAVTVTRSIGLDQGRIITAPLSLLTIADAAITSPINNWGEVNAGYGNSYLIGPVKVSTTDSIWRSIPIGSYEEFAPIRLKAPDPNGQTIMVEYKTGSYSGSSLLPSLTRLSAGGYYLISGSTGSRWKVGLSFIPADTPTVSQEVMTMARLQNVNGDWKWGSISTLVESNPLISERGYGWLLTDSLYEDLNALAIGYEANSLLPLNVISFAGTNAGRYNLLEWQADQDHHPATFIIERSADGVHFLPIASIPSAAAGLLRHEWKDHDPPSPKGYYRLTMKTANHSITSNRVTVHRSERRAVLFPNPCSDQLQINFSDIRSDTYIEIVNRYGAILRKFFVKKPVFQIGVSDLSPGLYYVRLRSPKETITLPFTKY